MRLAMIFLLLAWGAAAHASGAQMQLAVDRVPGAARDFTITGRTLPFAVVEASTRMTTRFEDGTTLHQTFPTSAVADASGRFAVAVHLPTGLPASGVDVSVVATDPLTASVRRIHIDVPTSR